MIIYIKLGTTYESMDDCKIVSMFGVNNGRSSILHILKILSTFDSIYENAFGLIHVWQILLCTFPFKFVRHENGH